jgi:hypothetical protein
VQTGGGGGCARVGSEELILLSVGLAFIGDVFAGCGGLGWTMGRRPEYTGGPWSKSAISGPLDFFFYVDFARESGKFNVDVHNLARSMLSFQR